MIYYYGNWLNNQKYQAHNLLHLKLWFFAKKIYFKEKYNCTFANQILKKHFLILKTPNRIYKKQKRIYIKQKRIYKSRKRTLKKQILTLKRENRIYI